MPWATLDVVDEESAYVRMLSKAVDRVVPLVRGLLGKLYFRNFCDKFAASFLPKFYDLVVNTKKMSEMGTHQLLLDLHSIKPAFLALPNAGLDKADENRKPPPAAEQCAQQRPGHPNFKGSYLGRFPLVLADFWTSDHLSERSRGMDVVSRTRARGTSKLKRR